MNFGSLTIREQILFASHGSGHGHIPTCFSVVEMLLAAYETMRHDPQNPRWSERDLFVLSKGHAALAHYCTLGHFGYFSFEDLKTFGAHNSRFGCHADRSKVPGVEVSTGSLGHGIAVAVGMSLALRIENSRRQVFTLVGDGESNEGSVWEAVMVAAHQKLDNLTILYDNNGSQIRCMPVTKPVDKFRSFDCHTIEVDGHDVYAIRTAIATRRGGPRVIVCNTVKGYGCRSLCDGDGMFAWHRRSPNAEELRQLIAELNSSAGARLAPCMSTGQVGEETIEA